MTRGRHYRIIFAASTPLALVIMVLVSGDSARTMIGALVGWAAGVVVIAEWSWRRSFARAAVLLDSLQAIEFEDAAHRISELRLDCAACNEERQLLAVLLEDLTRSLGEGLVVVDSKLHLRLINRTALQFCGAAEAPAGAQLLEVLREPTVVDTIARAAAGEKPNPVLVENPRGLWELRAFPIRGGGAVALISEESLVRRAAEFRRRFVQDLSHELRSPLAVLRTTVEAVEEEVAPRLAEILVRQVERLDRLSRELYDLATIESGQLQLSLEPVAVAPVVEEVARDSAPEAERVGVKLELETPSELSAVCDRRGLYRVLSNLVDNAVKYNRMGGWVRISAAAVEHEIRIRVKDNGEGIPASELQAVLQRFYRIDRARTPGRGGLGLGLAIVKHLVQHMGGRLELDSREGAGTTVTLYFPQA